MKKILATYSGLSKSVFALCTATLINRIGDFVVPFLTLYLTVKLNMNTTISGIIVTIAFLTSIPSSFIGGKLSDSLGKKQIYVLGQCLSAVFLIICGLIKNHTLIILFLLVSTFFNGAVRPAFNALLIDILPKEKRQEGISLNYLCINIGVAIGPIIAGILFNKFLQLFFILDGVTSLFAAFITCKYVKEIKIEHSETLKIESENLEAEEEGNVFTVLLKRPHLLMFFVLIFIYQYVYAQHKFTLPLSITSVLSNKGPGTFGYIMSVNAVTVVTSTVFITALMKKYHKLTSIAVGGLFFGFGMNGYVQNEAGFYISTFIWSLGEVFISINQGAFIADNSPINHRGRISAVHNVITFVGNSLSTVIGGVLVLKFSFCRIWNLIFIIALIASFFMYCLKVYCTKKIEKIDIDYEYGKEEAV